MWHVRPPQRVRRGECINIMNFVYNNYEYHSVPFAMFNLFMCIVISHACESTLPYIRLSQWQKPVSTSYGFSLLSFPTCKTFSQAVREKKSLGLFLYGLGIMNFPAIAQKFPPLFPSGSVWEFSLNNFPHAFVSRRARGAKEWSFLANFPHHFTKR